MLKSKIHIFGLYSILSVNAIRGFPHLIALYLHRNRKAIEADTKRWLKLMKKEEIKMPFGFIYLMVFYSAYRNLFYYRIGSRNIFLNFLFRKMDNLTIATSNKIGEGLFFPHGYSTTIGANSIGTNCIINHNVTIGTYGDENRPDIGDNVTINAGAIIFGKITIGNNVVIGANATVYTNIPDNSTVFTPHSKVIKWEPLGEKS